MKAELVCDALSMAIWQRKPKAGLIHHSDRGTQYASKKFKKLHTGCDAVNGYLGLPFFDGTSHYVVDHFIGFDMQGVSAAYAVWSGIGNYLSL